METPRHRLTRYLQTIQATGMAPKPYLPSKEEIEKECLRIQDGWSELEKMNRSGGKRVEPLQIKANTLRRKLKRETDS